MARVIGDGGLFYYIQDVIFIPEYQRQGIGTQLMDGERWNKSERMPAKTRSLA
ncbi:MAG: GNAT family N-acetyltransferase [Dehalococcoidia bacterium]|nr:GNAT family N-acetyltransferase [Dehalococcoidia bacterium]